MRSSSCARWAWKSKRGSLPQTLICTILAFSVRSRCVNHAPNARTAFASVKCVDLGAHSQVTHGEPFPLTQILGPGLDKKSFDVARGIGCVLEQSPSHGAVAKPYRP